MAKSAEDVFSTSESVAPLRLNSRPIMSPELSPKTGTSELAFDDSSFDSQRPPPLLEAELQEIRQASELVCRSAQESLHEFRSCSASVKRKILSMEKQMASLRSSFVDVDHGSKSSLRVLDEFASAFDGRKEQSQLTAMMKELQSVQDLLLDKEREFEKREQENAALKKDLSRLEQLVAEAAKRKEEGCVSCECHKCRLF